MKYTRGYLDLINIIMQLQVVVVVLVSCHARQQNYCHSSLHASDEPAPPSIHEGVGGASLQHWRLDTPNIELCAFIA